MRRILVVCTVLVLASAALAGGATAAVFNVNVTWDAADAFPGNGACADAAGACTLRAAVMEANALPGWDGIRVPAGVYPLTLLGAGEDFAKTGDLDAYTEISISGAGPRRTIVDGQQRDRVFDVRSTSVSLEGLGIRNGFETFGGGIRARRAKLSLRWDALTINGAYSAGGGIYAEESHVGVAATTFTENRASDLGGAAALVAVVGSPASAGFENATLSRNSARRGGGLFLQNVSTTLRNDTIAGNYSSLGGGVYWLGLHPRAYNTSIAYNSGQDCSNPLASVANNNDTDKTCGFFGAGDLPGVDPLLAPLTYLGVVTPNWVHPLLAGSPLRDAGDPATCAAVDEVGQARPLGARCDIGAYEQP